ncbi:hypothetical protein BC465_05035 [Neisseria meningitidis]|nr:hypothetical protein BC465_05035 [Neisseria meningitidis]
MNRQKYPNRHSRAGGNLDRSVRKLIGKKGFSVPESWIPTFVGMTGCRFVGMTWCRFPCGWIRHSRAGGNLVCSVSVISDKCLLLFISRFPLSWE